MSESSKLSYVANAGVLQKRPTTKILIGGLGSPEVSSYKATPASSYQQMIEGLPPFNDLDLMLITHHHSDHFDVDRTCELLRHNPQISVVSSNEVISRLQDRLFNPSDYNLIALSPLLHGSQKVIVQGLNIEAISLTHDGKEFGAVTNYAYLIQDELNILHLGDAAAIPENFRGLNLREKEIDLLIASFPYIGLPSARKLVQEYINPQKIVIVHLPKQESDHYGWIAATKKSYERVKDNYIATEFLEQLGQSLSL